MFPALEDIETEKLVAELKSRGIHQNVPASVVRAMQVVQKYHPEVCYVTYDYADQTWLYTDALMIAPDDWKVPNSVISILENALGDVNESCRFYLPREK
jgi:hypothetical protein